VSNPSILMLAGEASGDYHAAALTRELKALRPDIRVVGIGGDQLARAGMELLYHYRDINTIGLSEGLGQVRNIVSAYSAMKREIRSRGYDLFIPVDFPDVNLRLCQTAKRAGLPVYYYISPQVWAWRKGRIRKIAARVDRIMTIFPFEELLYRNAGVKADFVGHTMVNDIPGNPDKGLLRRQLGIDRSATVVAIVPGSRPAEIERILPRMCHAAELFLADRPDAKFVIPLAAPHLGHVVDAIVSRYRLPLTVHSTDAAVLMAACDCGLVTSGTATLQAALAEMPHAVVYVLDRFTWWLALRVLKPLVMEKDIHVAIANVLSIASEGQEDNPISALRDAGFHIPCRECGRPLFVPELLQDDATPENLAAWLVRYTSEEPLRQATIKGFKQIRAMLAPPAHGKNAARIVLECVGK
jgi:lipid-A-disaccharide synthase